MGALIVWALVSAGCSASATSQRRGVIEDIGGCELSRIGKGWASVDGGETVTIHSRRMRYATVHVHRAENAEILAADVVAGRLPQYADDYALPRTHATSIKVGRTDYPALWVGTPNVTAYVFVPSKEDGYVFLVWVDLSLSDEEHTKEQNMQRVGRWLRPLFRSLENASGDSVRGCLPRG